jgi:hypothetical protein
MVGAGAEPKVGRTKEDQEHLVLHYLQVLLRPQAAAEAAEAEAPKPWLQVEVEV